MFTLVKLAFFVGIFYLLLVGWNISIRTTFPSLMVHSYWTVIITSITTFFIVKVLKLSK